jgi:hypothetical protein
VARYQATVPSHRTAAETFTYLATFSNTAEWDPGVEAEIRLRGPLHLLDPLLRPGFRAVADRAAAGLAQALSRDPAAGTTASPGTTVPTRRGAPRPGDAP